MEQSLSIGADHPSLPGHFPGKPIVPGVVLLDAIIADLVLRHRDTVVGGVKRLKFVNPLAPGQEFSVVWTEARGGGWRFRALAGADVVAEGQFLPG